MSGAESKGAREREAPGSPVPSAVRPQRLCVVGAGYVGLTAAACLAELGHEVACLESDPGRLAVLRAGGVPIHEPGLGELISGNVATGRLSFTSDPTEAMRGAAISLLCVGTPPRPDGDPDLRALSAAACEVVAAAAADVVLVVKSTVPPGSCEALELLAQGHGAPGVAVRVVSNPEFLRESEAVWDFFNPDRVVIGSDEPGPGDQVQELFPASWPMVRCGRRSAELVKYAANTFLAVKISFANEVAALCEGLGADARHVLAGVGLDLRIGGAFLNPGPGFGGSCLPKDLSGFIAVADSVGEAAPLARAAQLVNEHAISGVIAKLEATLGTLSGRRVAVLGLAFKPGTDDVRSSPGVALCELLRARGVAVTAHDPLAAPAALSDCRVGDPLEAARGADAVVVATAWSTYRSLDPERLREAMSGHVVLDAVGALDAEGLSAAGLDVYGTGSGRALRLHPVVCRPLTWMEPTGSVPAGAG